MFELWRDPPFPVLRLFKYIAAPPAVAGFAVLLPLLWAVPRRRFPAAALAASLLFVAATAGPTLAAIIVAFAFVLWGALALAHRAPAIALLAAFEIFSLFVFHLPWRLLPAYGDPRLARLYPGLFTDRELFFYLGLAYTALRALHLCHRAASEPRPPFSRLLLYLVWAPTFRIGPFVPFDELDREIRRAGGIPPGGAILAGLAEAALGGAVFEAVIQGIDRFFFRRLGPDDGSYWYYWFFDRPPESRLVVLAGIVLVALRYYLLLKAYSHVARGLSRAAGVPLPASMRWPLLSRDLASFWRRYNVTISRFAEDHVLKPVAASSRPAVAVAAAFLFMGLWHRPAWHTAAWAAAQIAGIAIWWQWRALKRRSDGLRRAIGFLPRAVREAAAVVATLAFVAATVPLLLDLHHGGARVYGRLLRREGGRASSRMIAAAISEDRRSP